MCVNTTVQKEVEEIHVHLVSADSSLPRPMAPLLGTTKHIQADRAMNFT